MTSLALTAQFALGNLGGIWMVLGRSYASMGMVESPSGVGLQINEAAVASGPPPGSGNADTLSRAQVGLALCRIGIGVSGCSCPTGR